MSSEVNMDNFEFVITAMGRKAFDLAFQVGFSDHDKATHYMIKKVHPNHAPEYGKGSEVLNEFTSFIFFWTSVDTNSIHVGDSGLIELPFEMGWKEAADMAWGWLNKKAKYDEEPDHDGSNSKGWCIRNESWGHAGGYFEGFLIVEPAWAMQGK